MAILKIARMGHPVLGRVAEAVADPTAPEIRRLVEDMIETMEDATGAGLAAPQVHVSRRVVIFKVAPGEDEDEIEDDGEGDEDEDVPLTVLVNPELTPLGDDMAMGWEGCLSVPGLTGAVPRHTAVCYRGVTPDGHEIERIARGFHARLVQHECDHLDGILYPMRMPDLSLLGYTEEVRRVLAERADEDDAPADEAEEAAAAGRAEEIA